MPIAGRCTCSWRSVETKEDLALPTFTKIGEPTEDYKKRTAEALTAMDKDKDPTKMDRSATYVCTEMAKPVVKSRLSKRWLVQLPYVIGVAKPFSISVRGDVQH